MSGPPCAAVVTGLGALLASGAGRGALEATLAAGALDPAHIDDRAGYHAQGGSRRAALVSAVDWRRWIPAMDARRMSPPARFCVVAAHLALEDAGLPPASAPDPSLSISLATAFGPSSYTQRLLDQILDGGPPAASPALFTECVANAPASRLGVMLRACGPQHTIVGGEAGPLRALARGAAEVRSGRSRAAFVGASEEITPFVHAALDRLRALARPDASGREQGRPFDRARNGFLAAEGAVVLIVEPEVEAKRRGAKVLARVVGTGAAFDATAPPHGWGRGAAALARALTADMQRCGLDPGSFDLIVSGASGSRAGDRLEGRLLRRVWGERPLPRIVTPKATLGEYGGGFLAAAVLAAAGRSFGPTSGFEELDPDLRIRPHDGSPVAPPRRVLVTSAASGGTAAWAFLEPA